MLIDFLLRVMRPLPNTLLARLLRKLDHAFLQMAEVDARMHEPRK